MKEFVEKLIGRLEKYKYSHLIERDSEMLEHCKEKEMDCEGSDCFLCVWDKATEIVNQLAEEYNNGWINADVKLPTENGWYWGYYVTASYIGADGVKHTECKYASIYWEDNIWLYDPRSFRTVDEVIAWKPIAPYQPKGE